MKPLTAEWVSKAEGDYVCVQREWRARKHPNYDALCFHAQQCIEKYLKACLQEYELPVNRTHNLIALLEHLLPYNPILETLRVALLQLILVNGNIFRNQNEDFCRPARRRNRSVSSNT